MPAASAALVAAVWVLNSGSVSSNPAVWRAWAAEDYGDLREAMVGEQIIARGVSDHNVLAALRGVPRHRFVPRPLVPQAYSDRPLPIGNGQTISQPYIVAFMSELLDLRKSHKVLEIGTGCGYQAAVLSGLAGKVYSMEIVKELGVQARERLQTLGYDNVVVRIGNGYAGWPEQAPFDRIILTAAPNELPQALVDQLKPGGKLVAPVGPVYGNQELVVVTKDAQGKVRRQSVLPVRFVPMVQAPE